MRQETRGWLGWTMAAAGAVVGFLLAAGSFSWGLLERDAAPVRPAPSPKVLEALTASERRTIDVFQRTSQSVVNVSSSERVRSLLRRNPIDLPLGHGSGFVWDKKGHVVTNFHVVNGGNSFTVTLWDKTSYPAKPVGIYPDKDLAVLRIEAPADRLTPVKIGNSGDLIVGQNVLAIGNPFGLDQTLTTGIVSALDREITSLTGAKIIHVIQTDAAINPGNSGGPLLDSSGQLIGINTMIVSPSNGSAGIGFAVPIDIVNHIVPQLIEHGKLKKPFHPVLGVKIDDKTQRLRNYLQILSVIPGSGAESGGLRANDIIVRVDGVDVQRLQDLQYVLEKRRAGDGVQVTYYRGRKAHETTVTLDEP
jgi:S1-C subfamily serine protease